MSSGISRQLVTLCEPQCHGFEHAPFNAALLRTVCLAYPCARVVFHGEATHVDQVRKKLVNTRDVERVDFRTIRIPDRKVSGLRRLPQDFRLFRQLVDKTSSEHSEALVLCSVGNTGLLSLKLLMMASRRNPPVAAVLHGCLARIGARPSRRPWNWLLDLRHVLALPHPSSLRLVVLSDSILENVKKVQPRRSWYWRSLDHVYLWPTEGEGTSCESDAVERPPRFGFVGVSVKGFEAFCRIADDVAPAADMAEFVMVGFYNGPPGKKPVSPFVSEVPEEPLPWAGFVERVGQLTYFVWPCDPVRYRFVASGTFLDAVASLKPGIYLRNDYIEHYFARMGDIGYLCDSHEEMVRTIKEIVETFPTTRYRRQVDNLRRGRVLFAPETLAPRLRQILEGRTI